MSRKTAPASRRRPAPAPRASRWPAALRTLIEQQPGHEPALDGLRGISSIGVVMFHCAVWLPAALPDTFRAAPFQWLAFWNQTWWGVDVFFVLSGFLIGRILFKRLQRGALGFRSFYLRRSFRIFPIYYLVLTASVFVFANIDSWSILYRTHDPGIIRAGSWANYLYVSNYLYGMEVPNALSWGWSLCVEEHFYLLLPAALALVFWLVKGRGRGLVLVPFAFLPLVFRWLEHRAHPEEAVFLWLHPMSHTHSEGLAIGVLIAYAFVFHHDTSRDWLRRLGPWTWIAGVAGIAAVMRFGGLRTPGLFPVVWQYFVVATSAALLVLNGLYLPNAFTRFLSWRVWTLFARISYCTYLIQMFVIFFVLSAWPKAALGPGAAAASFYAASAVVMLVASLIAVMTYLLFERPVLDYGATVAAKYTPPSRVPEPIAKAV